jgi:hypothetical protein
LEDIMTKDREQLYVELFRQAETPEAIQLLIQTVAAEVRSEVMRKLGSAMETDRQNFESLRRRGPDRRKD